MEPKGRFLGFDVGDAACVPVAAAMKLFNLDELNSKGILFAATGREGPMKARNRRKFLGAMGGSLAAFSLPASRAAQTPAAAPEDRLVSALRELNEAAGIGITPEEFERARAYASGVYREASAKLRPLVPAEGLDLPILLTARRRP